MATLGAAICVVYERAVARLFAGLHAGVLFLNGHKINRRVFASSVNFEIEFEPFAFVDALQAGTFHRADVHECVGLAIIPHEEAEALHCVEEFYRARSFFTRQLALGCAASRAFTAIAAFAAITAITAIAAASVRHRNDVTHDLKILRGNLAAAINQVEFQGLPFGQASQACAFDSTDMHECVFTAIILLDEAETLLRIEEFYRALASADDLCGHPAETAGTSTAAAAASTAARSAATAASTAATAASAEAIAATKPVAAAETIAAAAAVAIAAKTTLRFAAERGETVFTKTIALVAAPAPAPFIVTHNKIRTFVTPPGNHHAGTRTESVPDIYGRSRSMSEFPPNRL